MESAGEWHFVGFGIGHPLERAAQVEEGPDRDPMLGRDNTPEEEEYLADAPDFGQG